MAKADFANKWAIANGDAVTADAMWNNAGAGLQAEFLLRSGDLMIDGIVSGMGVSVSGADATIAVGRAYVAGKRYTGNSVVSFSGLSAGDYYLYIDSDDDTTPYKRKTTVPTTGDEVTLATMTWNGSVLSALDDNMKASGVLPYDLSCHFAGTLSVGDFRVMPVLRDLWIEAAYIICEDNGSSSASVVVDVHLGADGTEGTTIFTTQGNRPSLAHDAANYTLAVSGKADGDRKPDAGEHLVAEIDSIDGGGTARDLTLTVKARLR